MTKSLKFGLFLFSCTLGLPAQGQESELRWPESLKDRNARYAQLTRDLDLEGDGHEQVLADLTRVRQLDKVGDDLEGWRAAVAKKAPPRARLHARLERTLDQGDDLSQSHLASLPTARRHAEVRRFRDYAGDEQELQAWQNDKVRFGPVIWVERVGFAKENPDRVARRFQEERDEKVQAKGLTPAEMERKLRWWLEHRDEDRWMGLREDDDGGRLEERRLDAAEEREEGDLESELEELERDLEKDLDREADQEEGDLEREVEKEEADLDREVDRDLERQIQQEEEGTLAGEE